MTFIDNFSRKSVVTFLKTKGEVLEAFKAYKTMVELQTGKQIKMLRTDNGGEYMSKTFEQFCLDSGIVHQTTVPYTPK